MLPVLADELRLTAISYSDTALSHGVPRASRANRLTTLRGHA